MPRTPNEMVQAIAANLLKKTGRTLDEWIVVVRSEGPATRMERVNWLKSVHGIGHVTAQQIVWQAEKPAGYEEPTDDELLADQYAGPKAALRPIYDRLAAAVRSLGEDVRLEPRKTYVSLARSHQFGLIQPTTRTRVDLGLRLRGVEPTSRLQPAGSFGSGQVTHRIALASPDEVDDDVLGWLRAAYEQRG